MFQQLFSIKIVFNTLTQSELALITYKLINESIKTI